jgi:hypothetical protein
MAWDSLPPAARMTHHPISQKAAGNKNAATANRIASKRNRRRKRPFLKNRNFVGIPEIQSQLTTKLTGTPQKQLPLQNHNLRRLRFNALFALFMVRSLIKNLDQYFSRRLMLALVTRWAIQILSQLQKRKKFGQRNLQFLSLDHEPLLKISAIDTEFHSGLIPAGD